MQIGLIREKWILDISRDREDRLFRKVVEHEPYVICHLEGSKTRAEGNLDEIAAGRDVVQVTPRTDNFFDWLIVIERASLRVTIDNCFSNLTDQLRIAGPQLFIPRSKLGSAPVLLGDRTYAT